MVDFTLLCRFDASDIYLTSYFSALDPLFFAAQGSVERIFQKATLSGVSSDSDFTFVGTCSGHGANSPKAWLKGFYLVNDTINSAELTNSQLTNILNPNSVEYRNLINFVYDT
jgi:hypothetical protein